MLAAAMKYGGGRVNKAAAAAVSFSATVQNKYHNPRYACAKVNITISQYVVKQQPQLIVW